MKKYRLNLPKFALLFFLVLNLDGALLAQCTIADFPFNGNANDISGNGNNGTVFGATPTIGRDGITNTAYDFDGAGDYISINNTLGNFGNGDYSISLWLQTSYTGTQQAIMEKRNGCTLNSGFWGMIIKNGEIIFGNNSPNQNLFGLVTVNDGLWHHVVAIRADDTLKLYVDAQIDILQSGLVVNNANNTSDVTIGTSDCVGVDLTETFDGKLDDIKFFNCAISENEIETLFYGLPCTVYDTVTIYDTTTVTIFDTTAITVYDTIAVTDTLIIDVVLSVNPFEESTIKAYPNPTNNLLIIDNSNYAQMTNYTLKIVNDLGQDLFNSPFNVPTITIDLSQFASTGIYFLQILNSSSQIVAEKKIVLQ